jgi:hypothetical protein
MRRTRLRCARSSATSTSASIRTAGAGCTSTCAASDLTFSALAAAVLMPPQYGVPLPQPDELPPAMGAVVRELREHPAGRQALRMFREERR